MKRRQGDAEAVLLSSEIRFIGLRPPTWPSGGLDPLVAVSPLVQAVAGHGESGHPESV